jgi:hypothetical protein
LIFPPSDEGGKRLPGGDTTPALLQARPGSGPLKYPQGSVQKTIPHPRKGVNFNCLLPEAGWFPELFPPGLYRHFTTHGRDEELFSAPRGIPDVSKSFFPFSSIIEYKQRPWNL